MPNNSATITRDDCNSYTVTNNEVTASLQVEVQSYADGSFTSLETSSEILPSGTYTYNFTSDGAYRIIVSDYNGGSPINPDYYDIVIYCDIQTCMISTIKSLVCSPPDCDECLNEYNTKLYFHNSLLLTFYTFMLELNNLAVNNWGYTVLDPNDLAKLADIEDLITTMTTHCDCIDDLFEDDCGCS